MQCVKLALNQFVLKMKKQLLSFILLCFASGYIIAQDFDYSKKVISELSSEKYHGRGYYEQGDLKAAKYIASEYQNHELKSFGPTYFQEFNFPVNTYQGDMEIKFDGKAIEAGKDFMLREYSKGVTGEFTIYHIDTVNFDEEKYLKEIAALDTVNTAICVDFGFIRRHKSFYRKVFHSPMPVLIFKWTDPLKMYKAYSAKEVNRCIVWADSESVPVDAKTISLNINNHFIDDYITQNVIGYKPAKNPNAKWIVMTAHYDHLGMFGRDIFFPGANDNASGVSMLLSVAKHFDVGLSDYNIAFMSVAGEECGLLGSKYYVDHPLFPIEDIELVINFDMIADNATKLAVEHNEESQKEYDKLLNIVNDKSYFEGFDDNELEAHSDHFPFSEKELPVIYFSNHGDAFQYYHTPIDDMDHIYMSGFENLYRLIVDYLESI